MLKRGFTEIVNVYITECIDLNKKDKLKPLGKALKEASADIPKLDARYILRKQVRITQSLFLVKVFGELKDPRPRF